MAAAGTMRDFLTLRSWKLWQKSLLIAALLLAPLIALAYQSSAHRLQEFDAANRELSAIESQRPLRSLFLHLQQRRALAARLLAGDVTARAELDAKTAQVDRDLAAVEAAQTQEGGDAPSAAAWTALKETWRELKAAEAIDAADAAYRRHSQLLADLAASNSKLGPDPDGGGGPLQRLRFRDLPSATDRAGRLVARGAQFAARAASARAKTPAGAAAPEPDLSLSEDERVQLGVEAAQWEEARQAMRRDLDAVVAADPSLKGAVGKVAEEAAEAAKAFRQALDDSFLKSKAIKAAPADWQKAGDRVLDADARLGDALDAALVPLLQARVHGQRDWLVALIGGVLAAVGLAALMGSSVFRGVERQSRSVQDVFTRVAAGDYAVRAEVYGGDELGAAATSLNGMLDATAGLLQTREEKDRIQASIQKLLEEISGVAEGDLTKEAEVTADVTGAIADSFNFMIEQLRRIVGSVQAATRQVGAAARDIHDAAERLVQGSEAQARRIATTSGGVEDVARSVREVAANAGVGAETAAQAQSAARQGGVAARDTIGGMNRIRDRVQETSKRIKRLGESSQQIGEIVQLIDDIADRTGILALNASIQAAAAGEAGRGFAVVAEEIERLADRSTAATRKIAALVKAIQGETGEAVTAMEDSTREVVEGSKLANQAGAALTRIESTADKLADLIRTISEASKSQAGTAEEIAAAMSEISEITQQTAAGTRQGAVAVTQLATLADDLRASVGEFRLPGQKSRFDLPTAPSRLTGRANGTAREAAKA
jgi:twitching motility protein PilJ